MPTATNGDEDLYYETAGAGPTVAFVEPAGYGAWCWSWLVDALAGPVETLVWDLRGTGRSDAPPGPYDVATLAADLEAVLADHGTRTVHLVGAGLGGMVALQHAREYGRATTLALLGTTADGSRVDADALRDLQAPRDDRDALRASLTEAFSPGVVEAHPEAVDRIAGWRADDDAGPDGWDAQIGAMLDFEMPDLYTVTTPSLVVHGRADAVVPVEAGRDLAEDLPKGTFEGIDAGHLVAAEEPTLLEDALAGQLNEHADLDG
ncbi:alpha/beta fold hydrolase [Halorientalis pallida]|uniref:Alpha/beta fold hydrolase n=1 Tax=Halorientalis pallida TaxID=2479928 RepID=A0A498KXG4_9EURY|nr:alpha/beta hydrolase [Halorientalis pallida]RXK46383.1 alpha/beta fold hydrolase [Halorientalis pallida]